MQNPLFWCFLTAICVSKPVVELPRRSDSGLEVLLGSGNQLFVMSQRTWIPPGYPKYPPSECTILELESLQLNVYFSSVFFFSFLMVDFQRWTADGGQANDTSPRCAFLRFNTTLSLSLSKHAEGCVPLRLPDLWPSSQLSVGNNRDSGTIRYEGTFYLFWLEAVH